MPIVRRPLFPIVYVAPVETMTSPGCKLFSQSETVHLLESLGSNGFPCRTQFAYAPAGFSQHGTHYSYVAFGKTHVQLKLLPDQNVVFNSRLRRSFLSARYYLPLLGSASLLALALVHALSVALPRPVSSLLLSFVGDASPSIGLLPLLS